MTVDENVSGKGKKNYRMMWLYALSPVHVGSGRGVGFIDLPIIREKVTNYPLVPGSTIKGVFRAYWVDKGI
ncbi:MAG: RAMP superfamily CRISPR-associated protein, partial [Promethearchaeota archaeon]